MKTTAGPERIKFIPVIFSILIVAILIAGYIFFKSEKERIIADEKNDIKSITRLKEDEIFTWYNERIANANVLAENYFIKESIYKTISDKVTWEYASKYLNSVKNKYGYRYITFIDGSNKFVFKTSTGIKLDSTQKTECKKAAGADSIINSGVRINNITGEIYTDFYIPIKYNNKKLGVLLLNTDPSERLFKIVNKWYLDELTGESNLGIINDGYIYYLNHFKNKENKYFDVKVPIGKDVSRRLLSGNGVYTQGIDYKGKEVLSYIVKLKGTSWYLVTSVSYSSIISGVLKSALMIGITVILLIIFTGIFISAAVTKRNLAEKEKSEKEIIKSGQKYKELFLNNPHPMWTYDLETLKILEVNDAAINSYGYSHDEFLSMTIKDLRPKEDVPALMKNISRSRSGLQTSGPWRHRKKNGTIILVEIASHVLPDNKQRLVLSSDVTEKTNYEAILKENEEKFRMIFENSNDAILLYTPSGKVLAANSAACGLFKLSKNTILSLDIKDILISGEKTFSGPNYPEGKNEFRNEVMLMRRDGTSFYSEISTSVFENHNNEVHISIIIKDITERTNVENKLKESEERLKRALISLPFPAIIHTDNGEIIFINKQWQDITGYTELEITTIDDWLKRAYGNEYTSMKETASKIYNISGKLDIGEFFITTKSGGKRIWHFSSAPLGLLNNNRRAIITVAADVTEERQKESQLHMLSRAIEQATSSVIITDTNGRLVYANDLFYHISGYMPEELKGKLLPLWQYGFTSTEEYNSLINILKDGKIWKGEFINKRKNNEEYWVATSISPIYDNKDEIVYFLIVEDDITEKKRMDIELLKAKQRAEDLNKVKSHFLANMSHELRTPLVGILGFSDILSSDLEDEEQRMMAESISRSGKRLLETLNLILDLSKIEANKLDTYKEIVNLAEFVPQEIKVLEGLALVKGLYLKVEVENPDMLIFADRRMLRDIVLNLVNNAVKFTREGGVIIKIYKEPHGNKNVSVLMIKDTGIGIPEESQQMIFEEFRQASEGMSRSFEGSGLGLTVAKRLVELLGGTIELESKVGEGSTFYIKLPILHNIDLYHSQDKIVTNEEIALPGENAVLPKVLVVENDEMSSSVISYLLKKVCNVEIANDGQTALDMAEKDNYAVILMDINLGKDISGLEVTRKLREMGKYKSTPIIAVTAYAMVGDKEEFLNAGCSHYISKPFTKEELLRLMNEVLPVHRS